MVSHSSFSLPARHVPTLLSQPQIAEMLGITTSRVGQIERIALQKIRRAILRDRVLCQLAAEAGCLMPAEMPTEQETAA